ncbi:MAG: hypothetical protein ACREO3_02420 [Arenimonas sp.]
MLRQAFLTMLVLGLIIRPTLIVLCDAHAADHTLASHPHHSHSHDDGALDDSEDEHAHGVHGLMHAGAFGGAADMAVSFELPSVMAPAIILPMPTAPIRPRHHAAGPFRPPIA